MGAMGGTDTEIMDEIWYFLGALLEIKLVCFDRSLIFFSIKKRNAI